MQELQIPLPKSDRKLGIQNVSEMVDQIMKLKNNRMAMVAPLINNEKVNM